MTLIGSPQSTRQQWISRCTTAATHTDCLHLLGLMPGFHHSIAVLPLSFHCTVAVIPFRATVAVARENGIGGNVFPLTAFEQ